jgi:hypothetical protein
MNPLRKMCAVCALFVALVALPSCSPPPDLVTPSVLVSPYDSAQGEALWAVAPLRNESGTSAVDALAVTDTLIAKVQETRGVACVPLNRVIAAMRALGLPAVRTPGEARTLAQALGVDAIIAGTITAYDPYDPPTIGLTLGLYGSGTGTLAAPGLDPRQLASSGQDVTLGRHAIRPLGVASEHADARNHEVLMDLKRYASGRVDERSALGWRSYTASMELFTQFAAHRTLERLFEAEQMRQAQVATARYQTQAQAQAGAPGGPRAPQTGAFRANSAHPAGGAHAGLEAE